MGTAHDTALRLVEASDQKQAPGIEVIGMGCVRPVSEFFKRFPGGNEPLHRLTKVPGNQRNLGCGNTAACPRHGLSSAKGPLRPAQQVPCLRQIPELRHRDAAQRERRRVLAQGDVLQGGKRIA